MTTISFDPTSTADMARAFAEFAGEVDRQLCELRRENSTLAHVIRLQATALDVLATRSTGPIDGRRCEVLHHVAVWLQQHLADTSQPPVELLRRLTDEAPRAGPSLRVVGGTDTGKAGESG